MSTATLIGTLPQGSFYSGARGPFRIACLQRTPSDRGHCFRPQGHGGRHAFISLSGRVWAVWGEDVHKAARERGRRRPFALVDKVTHEPCPTLGDRLCTITDPEHLHMAEHMIDASAGTWDGLTVGEPPC